MTSRSRTAQLLAVAGLMLALGPAGLGIRVAHAQGSVIYGALILATNSDHPEPTPELIRPQEANLKKVFGYNEFRLLDQEKTAVSSGKKNWFIASKQFSLRVDSRGPVTGGYALGLELLQEDRVVVDADVKVARERPLFIRGPFVAKGQLLILLTVL